MHARTHTHTLILLLFSSHILLIFKVVMLQHTDQSQTPFATLWRDLGTKVSMSMSTCTVVECNLTPCRKTLCSLHLAKKNGGGGYDDKGRKMWGRGWGEGCEGNTRLKANVILAAYKKEQCLLLGEAWLAALSRVLVTSASAEKIMDFSTFHHEAEHMNCLLFCNMCSV